MYHQQNEPALFARYGLTASYFSYANCTADLLGADYYAVANGGWQLCYTVSPSYTIQRIYPYATMRDTTSAGRYDFSWKPQVVVINLGTNDWARTQAEIQENVRGLLALVRQKNPDAAIVWAYGAMDHDHPSVAWIKAAVETFARQDKNAYFVHLPENTSGWANPPMCRDKPRLPKCSQKKSGPLWAGRRAHYEESSCCFWDFCAGRPPLCACCLRGGDSRVDGAVRSRGITGTSPLPSPLGSLPEGTGISYAQIELSLQPGDFSLREDSFSWLPKDAGVLVSPQWNSGRLLLLLEPQNAAFAGLDAQPLFSLRLQNKTGGKTGPVFQITYILIDRAGKETLYTGLCETSGQKPAGFFRRGLLPSGSGPLPVSRTYPLLWKARARGSISPVKMRISAAISGWVYPLVISLAVCLSPRLR